MAAQILAFLKALGPKLVTLMPHIIAILSAIAESTPTGTFGAAPLSGEAKEVADLLAENGCDRDQANELAGRLA